MKFKDSEYKVLKVLESKPNITQRGLASELGISLGKTHYVLKALIDRGWVKLENFKRSDKKLGYLYVLTPTGILKKSVLARNFLEIKTQEYEKLKKEIELLKKESEENQNPSKS